MREPRVGEGKSARCARVRSARALKRARNICDPMLIDRALSRARGSRIRRVVTGLFVNGVEDRRADGRSAGRVASKCKSSAHWPAERGAAGHAAARRVLLLHLHRAVANTSTSPWRGWRERAGAAALEHPVVFERTASTAVVGYRINWHASARLCAALCATRCRLPAEVCGIAAFTPPSAPALPWQLPPSHSPARSSCVGCAQRQPMPRMQQSRRVCRAAALRACRALQAVFRLCVRVPALRTVHLGNIDRDPPRQRRFAMG